MPSMPKLVDDTFVLVRSLYNKGSASIKESVINGCMDVIIESIVEKNDKLVLMKAFNTVKGVV
ncbi:MAG: hypothetical protein K8E24_005395 [Methanobacterium paludis]|nr:hypothetical protein [Methanobacterium paludis]